MKSYILLGIGIGMILTSIMFSFQPKEDIDISKLVEIEVQKRLKKIEELQEVENSFKEVVQLDKEDKKEITYYSKDKSANAVYYIQLTNSKDKEKVLSLKDETDKFIETEIQLIGGEAYLFSEYPYSVDNSNEIIKKLKSNYNIEAKKLKLNDIEELKNSVTKTVKKNDLSESTGRKENSAAVIKKPSGSKKIKTEENIVSKGTKGLKKIEKVVAEPLKKEVIKKEEIANDNHLLETTKEVVIPKESM